MILAPEVVGDIPVVGSDLAGYVFAMFHVSGFRLLSATDVGPNRAPGDSAAHRGKIIAASIADLMPEYAAEYSTDKRSRNVDPALLLGDLFLVDPASLLGCSDHGAHCGDLRVVKSFVVATPIVVDGSWRRSGSIPTVIDLRVPAYIAHR